MGSPDAVINKCYAPSKKVGEYCDVNLVIRKDGGAKTVMHLIMCWLQQLAKLL